MRRVKHVDWDGLNLFLRKVQKLGPPFSNEVDGWLDP
jgi:hypothetical protein